MADNKSLPLTGSGDTTLIAATKEVAFSGETTDVQLIELVAVTGTEGARTLNEISSAAGVLVDLGANNDVTVTGTVTVDGSGVTQPVSASSLPLPTGAATAANQLPDGHNVTIDNAAGASAVNIQDGGNSITVDGTVTANAGTGTFTVDTELPAAAAMADAAANPTVPAVGARNSVYNGSTWDRMRGNTTGTYVHGGTAHDAVDAGNPVKIGGKAYAFDGTAPGTAVAENDRVNFIATTEGRQLVETAHPNHWRALGDYAAAQTNATLKAAPGAGLKLYVTDVIISNGATAGEIALLDGSGGSKIFSIHPAVNGGAAHSFRTPLALTANTLLAVTSVTVTTHDITVAGYIAP